MAASPARGVAAALLATLVSTACSEAGSSGPVPPNVSVIELADATPLTTTSGSVLRFVFAAEASAAATSIPNIPYPAIWSGPTLVAGASMSTALGMNAAQLRLAVPDLPPGTYELRVDLRTAIGTATVIVEPEATPVPADAFSVRLDAVDSLLADLAVADTVVLPGDADERAAFVADVAASQTLRDTAASAFAALNPAAAELATRLAARNLALDSELPDPLPTQTSDDAFATCIAQQTDVLGGLRDSYSRMADGATLAAQGSLPGTPLDDFTAASGAAAPLVTAHARLRALAASLLWYGTECRHPIGGFEVTLTPSTDTPPAPGTATFEASATAEFAALREADFASPSAGLKTVVSAFFAARAEFDALSGPIGRFLNLGPIERPIEGPTRRFSVSSRFLSISATSSSGIFVLSSSPLNLDRVCFDVLVLDLPDTDVVVTYDPPGFAPLSTRVPLAAEPQPELLVNASFETPASVAGAVGVPPSVFGEWYGDGAATVMASPPNLPAFDLDRILRVFVTTPAGAGDDDTCSVYQLLDLAPYAAAVDTGALAVEASVFCNRGPLTVDNEFSVRLATYDVGIGELDYATFTNGQTANVDAGVLTDTAPGWEQVSASLTLPAGSRILAVELRAVENVVNDTTSPEFPAHAFDAASLRFR